MTQSSPADPPLRRVAPLRAAGGVVLAEDAMNGAVVLVVHRPTHADWSLPKGHIDPGETAAVAALREVREETGVDACIVGDLGTTEHRVRIPHPTTKQVHWFVMRPAGQVRTGGHDATSLVRIPDEEVDIVAWWPTHRALTELTYHTDRALLDRAIATSRRDRR